LEPVRLRLVLAFLLYRLSCGLLRLLVRAGLDDQDLEIAVLRHQLRVLTRGGKRPRYGTADRALLSAVSRFLPQERWSAFGVVPETLKRWRRQLENRRDRRRRRGPGRPPIDPELRQLILRMGRENPRWGYLRIKGELLKLGITVSPTTIANVLRRGGLGRRPGGSGRRGRSSCGPRPSPSFPLVSLPPAWRIGLGTSRVLRLRPRRRQADSGSPNSAAPARLPAPRIQSVIRTAVGKSPSSPGCMGPCRYGLGVLVTDRPPLTFVLSPCLTTAGVLGSVRVSRPTARRHPLRPFRAPPVERSLSAVG
jgi:Homeodomain-like domain